LGVLVDDVLVAADVEYEGSMTWTLGDRLRPAGG
jgi:hypothetical protein